MSRNTDLAGATRTDRLQFPSL